MLDRGEYLRGSVRVEDPRWPSRIGARGWIATLAALSGLIALAVDIGLPAQPATAAALGVDADTVQLNLSLFMLGYALSHLVVGYLSDTLGRRLVLVAGLGMFTASSIACALSPTIELLITFRFLQGVGGAVAPVVARAMVRDTQPADQAARLLSLLLAAFALAPMVAPTIGSVVLDLLGWRAVLGTLALTGAVLCVVVWATLPETLPVGRRVTPSPGGLARNYAAFVRARGTRLPVIIACLGFAGQFAYVSDSPFVLIGGYGISERAFGAYFALTAFAMMVGSLLGARMIHRGRSPIAMIGTGTTMLVLGGALAIVGTRVGEPGILGLVVPMTVYFFGMGMCTPSATALALAPVPHIAGTASAAVGFLLMLSGAVSGYLTTRLAGSDPRAFALVVAALGVSAAALAYLAIALRTRDRRITRG